LLALEDALHHLLLLHEERADDAETHTNRLRRARHGSRGRSHTAGTNTASMQ
jgi:hypothetical protein